MYACKTTHVVTIEISTTLLLPTVDTISAPSNGYSPRSKSEFRNIDLSPIELFEPEGDEGKEFEDPPLSDLLSSYDAISESSSTRSM